MKGISPYYETTLGSAYFTDTLQLMESMDDNSVDLILTSPPFALTSEKEYGNKKEKEYIEWFLQFTEGFKRIIKPSGSFVVDLGGTFLKGHPVRSIYQFELLCRLVKEQGYYLAQEFVHYNPARLPSPAIWVNLRRVRVKDSFNMVWWLSKTKEPKANNRNVLNPYTKAMRALFKRGYISGKRPSGHVIGNKFGIDNGGSIPSNVLTLSNTGSDKYMVRIKEKGLKAHPARFPQPFASFFIRFLTDEGDTVFDPFAGSNTTGYVANKLGRKWISCDNVEEYVKNSMLRFEG